MGYQRFLHTVIYKIEIRLCWSSGTNKSKVQHNPSQVHPENYGDWTHDPWVHHYWEASGLVPDEPVVPVVPAPVVTIGESPRGEVCSNLFQEVCSSQRPGVLQPLGPQPDRPHRRPHPAWLQRPPRSGQILHPSGRGMSPDCGVGRVSWESRVRFWGTMRRCQLRGWLWRGHRWGSRWRSVGPRESRRGVMQ